MTIYILTYQDISYDERYVLRKSERVLGKMIFIMEK